MSDIKTSTKHENGSSYSIIENGQVSIAEKEDIGIVCSKAWKLQVVEPHNYRMQHFQYHGMCSQNKARMKICLSQRSMYTIN